MCVATSDAGVSAETRQPIIAEHDRAVLTVDLPDHALIAGDIGYVVHIHGDHEAYELEVMTGDGHTHCIVTVDADQVRPVSSRDMVCVRQLSA